MHAKVQSNMMTLEELNLVTSSDQRSHTRYQQQLSVQVICPRVDQASVRSDIYAGWTDDVSISGARLQLPHSVTADSFWIRFPEAAPRDDFIECCVKWTDIPAEAQSELVSTKSMFRCGVEFLRILNREEFEQQLIDSRGFDE